MTRYISILNSHSVKKCTIKDAGKGRWEGRSDCGGQGCVLAFMSALGSE